MKTNTAEARIVKTFAASISSYRRMDLGESRSDMFGEFRALWQSHETAIERQRNAFIISLDVHHQGSGIKV